MAGVVKADAYGLGAARVGPALRDAGCRHFFVAHLAEGVALREALGPGPVVAVLNGFAPGADGDAALLPVLNGLGDVEAHAAAARKRDGAAPAILHLDTGMGRLGLDAREQEAVAADPSRLDGLDLRWLMTHLACADEPEHPLNAAQAARFAAICARLPAGVPRSVANSSGMFLGPALGLLSELIGSPEELVIVGVIVFLAGFFRLLYALLFEDGPYRSDLQRQPANVPQPQFAPPQPVSALPPQQSQPARAYAPPRPDTAELAYRPSVTEGTTRHLDAERRTTASTARTENKQTE